MQFEDSLKKIEEILRQLESGNLPLEQALHLYKDGSSLAEECKKELNEARLQVEQVNAGGSNDTGE